MFFLSRTSVDLKDKWRNMWKKAEKAQREKQPDQVVHLYSTRYAGTCKWGRAHSHGAAGLTWSR